eukprot:6182318-Pleurochrysis_carterae.AAC.3
MPTTNGLGATAGAGAGRAYVGGSGRGRSARGGHGRASLQSLGSGARALRKYACGATAVWESTHASVKLRRKAIISGVEPHERRLLIGPEVKTLNNRPRSRYR